MQESKSLKDITGAFKNEQMVKKTLSITLKSFLSPLCKLFKLFGQWKDSNDPSSLRGSNLSYNLRRETL